ncbi:MAG TPA: Sec-independent protein translocase protein TatB [Stellaceae bacterium]|nr:Sec-independent protein translocase protein TatB [Stellaceae bacterium]
MFDFAWSELALIAVVALVVIGPKDLPRVMRTAGMWVRKARAVAREFQGNLEQMVREAELEDVRQTVEQATRFNIRDEIERHVDPKGEIRGIVSDPTAETAAAVLPKPAAEAAPASPAPEPAAGPAHADAAPPVEGGSGR